MQGDPLKNWDAVGRCFDILKVDPSNLVLGQKFELAFSFSKDDFVDLPDRSGQIPKFYKYQGLHTGSMKTSSKEVTTAWDMKKSAVDSGRFTVADVTGELYSATLSASYRQASEDTTDRQSVLTYSTMSSEQFALMIELDSEDCQLNPELAQLMLALVDGDPTAKLTKLFEKFGTHFSLQGTLGGLATQRISVEREEFISLLEEGIDLGVEAKATMEVAKVSGEGTSKDTRSKRFRESSKVKVEDAFFVGGESPQGSWDMWAMNIERQPGLIAAYFAPLYSLATEHFLKTDKQVVKHIHDTLQTATDSHIAGSAPGAPAFLTTSDRFSIEPAGGGHRRAIVTAGKSVSIKRAERAAKWTLEPATSLEDARLHAGRVYRLRDEQGQYLSAGAGSDDAYAKGDGLVGLRDTPDSDGSCDWLLSLAAQVPRDEIVAGDVFLLRSKWAENEDLAGYLMEETGTDAPQRRVFSFGKPKGRGTFWAIKT